MNKLGKLILLYVMVSLCISPIKGLEPVPENGKPKLKSGEFFHTFLTNNKSVPLLEREDFYIHLLEPFPKKDSLINITIINHSNSTYQINISYGFQLFSMISQDPMVPVEEMSSGRDTYRVDPGMKWDATVKTLAENKRWDSAYYIEGIEIFIKNSLVNNTYPENTTVYVSSRLTLIYDAGKYDLLIYSSIVIFLIILVIILVWKRKKKIIKGNPNQHKLIERSSNNHLKL